MVVLSQSEPGLVLYALLLFTTFVGITFSFLFLTGEKDNDARPFFFFSSKIMTFLSAYPLKC